MFDTIIEFLIENSTKIIVTILVALLALGLAFLANTQPDPAGDFKIIYSGPQGRIARIVDEEAAVVCYIGSNIDCLPLSDTRLGK